MPLKPDGIHHIVDEKNKKTIKVFVFEPEKEVGTFIKRTLLVNNYFPIIVGDRDELFTKLQSYMAQVFVISVSRDTGQDIILEIRENEKYKSIPIIAISVYKEDREPSLKNGANEFLSKPKVYTELLNIIEKYKNL